MDEARTTNDYDGHLVTAAEEIAAFRHVRPPLVTTGAGASRGAFPSGERNGRRLPLMVDFAEIVPVGPILQKSGIEWKGKNFEDIYSLISEKPQHRDLLTQVEKAVSD